MCICRKEINFSRRSGEGPQSLDGIEREEDALLAEQCADGRDIDAPPCLEVA